MFLALLACAERVGTVASSEPAAGRGPATIEPPIPAFEEGMQHVKWAGWSADGKEFGYCAYIEIVSCRFTTLDGQVVELRDRPDAGTEAPDPAMKQAIDARIAERGYGTVPGTWGYTEGLALTWRVTPGVTGTSDPVLEAGAKVRGSEKAFLPMRLVEPGWDRIHPEYLGLSPDGTQVAVLAHAYAGEYTDRFPLAFIPTEKLVFGAFSAGK